MQVSRFLKVNLGTDDKNRVLCTFPAFWSAGGEEFAHLLFFSTHNFHSSSFSIALAELDEKRRGLSNGSVGSQRGLCSKKLVN